MNVFDPMQSMNALAGGMELGGHIRSKQTQNALAPMVAKGDYKGAMDYAGSRGDLGQVEAMKTQYQSQLTAEQEQRRSGILKYGMSLLQMSPEQRNPQEVAQALQQFGVEADPSQFTDLSDDAIKRVLTSVQDTESLQAQYTEMQKQQEPYTLAPGARRFGPGGQEIAANPVAEKPEGPLSPIGDLVADLNAGRITPEQYQIAVDRMQKSDPGLDIQFGEGGALSGITFGSGAKGKETAIVRDANGQPVTSPGTQQALYNKAYSANNDWETNTAIVEDDIDRAIKLIDGGMAAGPAAATAGIPIIGGSTPAGQLENLISTIRANVGFDKLDEMRRNSPTGGALGNVTEKEITFLQAVKGSLEQDQSPENLKYNLERLQTFYANQRVARREALQRDYPDLATTAEFRADTKQQISDWNDADEARLRELEAKVGAQ